MPAVARHVDQSDVILFLRRGQRKIGEARIRAHVLSRYSVAGQLIFHRACNSSGMRRESEADRETVRFTFVALPVPLLRARRSRDAKKPADGNYLAILRTNLSLALARRSWKALAIFKHIHALRWLNRWSG